MEEHCECTGSAEAFIRAHEGPWAAVGGDFINGNPDSARVISVRMNYGIICGRTGSRPDAFCTGQNSSFSATSCCATMSVGDVVKRRSGFQWQCCATATNFSRTSSENRASEREYISQPRHRSLLLKLVLFHCAPEFLLECDAAIVGFSSHRSFRGGGCEMFVWVSRLGFRVSSPSH